MLLICQWRDLQQKHKKYAGYHVSETGDQPVLVFGKGN